MHNDKEHTGLIKDFMYEMWTPSASKSDGIFQLFDHKIIIQSAIAGKQLGANRIKAVFGEWVEAFPKLNLASIEVIKNKDTIITIWNCIGKHEGEFNGLDPTGKLVDYQGITIFKFNGSKVVKYKCFVDFPTIYSQIGAYVTLEKYPEQKIIRNDYNLLIAAIKSLAPKFSQLTNREIECISFLLSGRTAKEIALIISNSYRTVQAHHANAMYKIGVTCKSQLFENILCLGGIHLFRDLTDLLVKINYHRQRPEEKK